MKKGLLRKIPILFLCVILFTAYSCNSPTSTSPARIETPTSAQSSTDTNLLPTPQPHVVTPTLFLPEPQTSPEPQQTLVPAQDSVMGVTINTLSAQGGLYQMAQAGVQWSRTTLNWDKVEPFPGDRYWSVVAKLETQFKNAAANNIQLILVLEDTPAWALKPGYSCGAVASDKLSLLGDFVSDMVNIYSQPPYNIHYYELWNEPDVVGFLGCWGDASDPYYGGIYYAEMLKAVYPRIKAADLHAQVLVGGLLLDCDPRSPQPNCTGNYEYKTTSSKFLEGILANGGGDYFDGVSFHAYDYYAGLGQYSNSNWFSASQTTGPAGLAKAAYLRELLAEYDVPNKFLMETELALLVCGQNQSDADCLNDNGQREQTKSSYIVQAYVLAIVDGFKAIIWYSALGWRGSGLINKDLSPRPSYDAYKFAINMLDKAIYVSNNSSPEVKSYDFVKGDQYLRVIWSIDGNPHTISLPETTLESFDMFGNPVDLTPALQVDWNPVYLILGQ